MYFSDSNDATIAHDFTRAVNGPWLARLIRKAHNFVAPHGQKILTENDEASLRFLQESLSLSVQKLLDQRMPQSFGPGKTIALDNAQMNFLRDTLLGQIDGKIGNIYISQPLAGRILDDVVRWNPMSNPRNMTGCNIHLYGHDGILYLHAITAKIIPLFKTANCIR